MLTTTPCVCCMCTCADARERTHRHTHTRENASPSLCLPTRTLSLCCCQIKAWKAGHKGECVAAARADTRTTAEQMRVLKMLEQLDGAADWRGVAAQEHAARAVAAAVTSMPGQHPRQLPAATAASSGVSPPLFATLMAAPASLNIVAISSIPFLHASSSGVSS